MTVNVRPPRKRRRRFPWWARITLVAFLALVGAFAYVTYRVVNDPLALYESSSRKALARSGFERCETSGPAGPLVYWEDGSGPAIVLVHGAGHQAGNWAEVAAELVADHHVLVIDLPGHGESAPVEGPIAAAALYGGVESFLDHWRDKSPVVVGNSMGAWLTMVYAHRHPGALSRVVAVNGGALRSDLGGYSLLPRNREEARHLVDGLRDPSSPGIPDFVLDDLVEQSADGPVARMLGDLAGLDALVLDGNLGEIADPVDLVWGASDKLMPVSYAERLMSELPRARLTTISNCGHMPHSECPERFVEALRQVLASGAPPPGQQERPGGETGAAEEAP